MQYFQKIDLMRGLDMMDFEGDNKSDAWIKQIVSLLKRYYMPIITF